MSSGPPLSPRNETICRVLSFLMENSEGWFTSDTINQHLHSRVQPLSRVLDELVGDAFLANRQVGGLTLYALTEDPACRRKALQLLESTNALQLIENTKIGRPNAPSAVGEPPLLCQPPDSLDSYRLACRAIGPGASRPQN